MNDYMNCKTPVNVEEIPTCPQRPSAGANIAELREIQYKTLESLCMMHDALIGENAVKDHEKLLENFQANLTGLVDLTSLVCAQSRAIADLIKECRLLLGV